MLISNFVQLINLIALEMKTFKKTLNHGIILACIFALVSLISSCGTGNQQQPTSLDSLSAAKKVEKIVYPLPTPYDISVMLNKAGASFILTITNSVDSVKKYASEKARAINLGVYGADLSYSSTYNETQQTSMLFSATKKLTDDLGVNTPFSGSIQKKIEVNLTNKDTLYKIITDSYYDTFDYLNQNNKGAVSSLVICGGWIEGLYLASQLALSSKKNDEILVGIANQKKTIAPLQSLLQTYASNPDVAEVQKDLEQVKTLFDSYKEVNGKLKPNSKELEILGKTVETIRNKYISLR